MSEIIEGRAKPSYCGPASLKWAARWLGVEVEQEKLAEVMGTTYELGTDGDGMLMGVAYLGLTGEWVQNKTLEELEQVRLAGGEVILNWTDAEVCRDSKPQEDGHYSVLRCLNRGTIELDDPSLEGRITVLRQEDFTTKRWFDTIQSGERLEKWALVIQKPK